MNLFYNYMMSIQVKFFSRLQTPSVSHQLKAHSLGGAHSWDKHISCCKLFQQSFQLFIDFIEVSVMLFTQLPVSKDKIFTSACSLPVRKDFSVVFCIMSILDYIYFVCIFICQIAIWYLTLQCVTAILDQKTDTEMLFVNKIRISKKKKKINVLTLRICLNLIYQFST